MQEPARTGAEAFVGVSPEYRDPNRNAALTQEDVDLMQAVGLQTDAEYDGTALVGGSELPVEEEAVAEEPKNEEPKTKGTLTAPLL